MALLNISSFKYRAYSKKTIPASLILYLQVLLLPISSMAQDANYAQYTNLAILNINYHQCLRKATEIVKKNIAESPKIEKGVVYIFTEHNNVAIQIVCLKNKNNSVLSVNSVGVESGILSVYLLHQKIFTSIQNESNK